MSEIQTLDGTLSGNISSVSQISSSLSTIKNIKGNLKKINSNTQVEIEKTDGELTGEIISTYSISSNISNTFSISGNLSTTALTPTYPYYQGVYQVSPIPELDIILETSNKILQDDIIIKEIPYYETTNESGGYTVTIG